MIFFNKITNDRLEEKLIDKLHYNYKYITGNITNKEDLYKMIKYIYILGSSLYNFYYIDKLKRKGKLDIFKKKEFKSYSDIINKQIKSNKQFFNPTFGDDYENLKKSGKLKEIISISKEFISNGFNGSDFNDFVEHIGKDYELFIYFKYDAELNYKVYYNKKKGIKDSFLLEKMNEYRKSSGDYNLVVK